MTAAISSAVNFAGKTLWEVWGEPALTTAGLYEPQDRTYGRWKIPFSPMEKRLYETADIDIWFGKAAMPNGKDFVWYQVWEDKKAVERTGRQADMIFVHGTGVHGGTLASHSRRYLSAGFRLIVPDLPSHGYSSGVHVYQNDMTGYSAGVHAALHDVLRRDTEQWSQDNATSSSSPLPTARQMRQDRETFILGPSFGGLVALNYALHYPTSLREDTSDANEIPVDGIIAVGPMVHYSERNFKVGPVVGNFIRVFHSVFQGSRLELFTPHRKVLDKDPKVFKTLVSEDKRSHQGAFRVGHIAELWYSMLSLQSRTAEFKHPLFIQQGGQDRVIDFERCLKFAKDVASPDKRCVVYPVCQHVIYRKAKTEEEDLAGRVACIEDAVEWMCERSRGRGLMGRHDSTSSISSNATMVYEGGSPGFPLSRASSGSGSPGTPRTPLTPGYGFTSMSENNAALDAALTKPFFDPFKPIPRYPEDADESSDDSMNSSMADMSGSTLADDPLETPALEMPDHPLVAKAHPTTLPLLAKIAPESDRMYRSYWKLDNQLRPYDIIC